MIGTQNEKTTIPPKVRGIYCDFKINRTSTRRVERKKEGSVV